MSSVICTADFNPANNRILNLMLQKAGYVTERMAPLAGPLAKQSHRVLRRFMAGVIRPSNDHISPDPRPVTSYGRP
jgi:hypothetical protein